MILDIDLPSLADPTLAPLAAEFNALLADNLAALTMSPHCYADCVDAMRVARTAITFHCDASAARAALDFVRSYFTELAR